MPEHWRRQVARRAPQLLRDAEPRRRNARRAHRVEPPARPTEPPAQRVEPPAHPIEPLAVPAPLVWPDLPPRPAPDPPLYRELPARPERAARWPVEPREGHHTVLAPVRFPVLPDEPAPAPTLYDSELWPDPDNDRYAVRWPTLPDDAPLWSIPPSAFIEHHIRALDDEQRGAPWNG